MDAELLSKQISALQEGLVKLDSRLDAALAERPTDDAATAAYEGRIAALEEAHATCASQLQSLIAETTKIAEAEAREAEADAETAEAEADLMTSIAEAEQEALASPEEVTEEASEPVTEIEEEPASNPSNGADGARNQPNWLEKFLILR
jgi:chromosome segregation ATPase